MHTSQHGCDWSGKWGWERKGNSRIVSTFTQLEWVTSFVVFFKSVLGAKERVQQENVSDEVPTSGKPLSGNRKKSVLCVLFWECHTSCGRLKSERSFHTHTVLFKCHTRLSYFGYKNLTFIPLIRLKIVLSLGWKLCFIVACECFFWCCSVTLQHVST